jgi:hypothetical protein
VALSAPFPVQTSTVDVEPETFYRMLDDLFSEGVARVDDLRVVQHSAGTSVSVAVDPGDGYVSFGSASYGGVRRVRSVVQSDSGIPSLPGPDFINTFSNPDPTDPRIDRVVALVQDADLDDSGQYRWRYTVVQGSAAAGATLGNLTGAGAVPANAMLLANVLVPAAGTVILTANIDTTVRERATIGAGRLPSTGVSRGLELVEDVTLGGSDTFDISSIPSTFHSLLIVASLRGATAATEDQVTIRFNADAGAAPSKYGWAIVAASGTTVSSNADVADTNGAGLGAVPAASAAGDLFGALQIWMPNYASPVYYKSAVWNKMSKSGTSAGSFTVRMGTVSWSNVAPITRVQIGTGESFGNFVAGSRVTVYGLKV